jgi:hypothetical protein
MPNDTVVSLPDIPVMFVAGERGRPIPEQAPGAFRKLEAKLPSLEHRKFYGAAVGDEYRACVAVDPGEEPSALPHPTWTIPGGKYVRRRIPDWEGNLHQIGPAFAELRARYEVDPSRPFIEHYRSQRELLLMVPVT